MNTNTVNGSFAFYILSHAPAILESMGRKHIWATNVIFQDHVTSLAT